MTSKTSSTSPPERITVIHAGLDSRFSAPAEGVPAAREDYILTVASLEPRKNLPKLLEAFALLREGGFDGRLRIAGGGGLDTPRINETIRRLGLEESVEKLGYVNREALVALYRAARVVVMPSLWEGFGLPLLEAMASETPLVASDIPVHREVAGDAALFAAPGDRTSARGRHRARVVRPRAPRTARHTRLGAKRAFLLGRVRQKSARPLRARCR